MKNFAITFLAIVASTPIYSSADTSHSEADAREYTPVRPGTPKPSEHDPNYKTPPSTLAPIDEALPGLPRTKEGEDSGEGAENPYALRRSPACSDLSPDSKAHRLKRIKGSLDLSKHLGSGNHQ